MTTTSIAPPQPRRPAGSSTGGQFAERTAGEPALDLLDGADLVRTANRVARKYRGSDAEDVASDGILAVLEARTRRGVSADGTAVQDGIIPDWRLSRGAEASLLTQAVRNAAFERAYRSRSGPDIAGRRLLHQRIAEHAAAGRTLTSAQVAALAAEIRSSFPEGRRPAEGYHISDIETPDLEITQPSALPDGHYASAWTQERIVNGHRAATRYTESEHEAAIGGHLDAGGRAGYAKARTLAFVAIAEVTGCPKPKQATLSTRQSKALRDAVGNRGGALAVARRILDDRADELDTRILAAPFGGASKVPRADLHEVASTLCAYPAFAAELFDSSISYSTVPRKTA